MKKQICLFLILFSIPFIGLNQGQNIQFSANYVHYTGTSYETRGLPIGDGALLYAQYPGLFTSINEANKHVYDGTPAQHSQNIQYDEAGNLKFFIIDGNVYDHEGVLLAESVLNPDWTILGENQFDLPEGNTETVIIQSTVECNKYFVIAATLLNSNGKALNPRFIFLSYELDFSTPHMFYPDRFGHASSTSNTYNVPTLQGAGDNCLNAHLAVSSPNSAGNRFLFVTACNGIRVVQISPSFVFSNPTGVASPFNVSENDPDGAEPYFLRSFYSRAEAEVIELGTGVFRHARVVSLDPECGSFNCPGRFPYQMIEIKDCSSGGQMTFPSGSTGRKRFYLGIYDGSALAEVEYHFKGIEFSPSGNIVWATTEEAPYLWYADLSQIITTSPYPLNGSLDYSLFPLIPATDGDSDMGQIEMGADGKIYYFEFYNSFGGSTALGTIDDPENPATTSYTFVPVGNNSTGIVGPVIESLGHSGQITGHPGNRVNYLLNDQVDGEIPPSMIPPSECCNESQTYFLHSYQLTSSEVWDDLDNPWINIPHTDYGTVKTDIIIPAGKTLTIKNLTVKFAENAKIIVKPGGRLNINNSHLTSIDCDDVMWSGVEVHGSPTLSPSSTNQGVVVMSNGSKISNAVNGIANGKMTSDNIADASTYGGRIYVYGSTFENNYRDLNYFPYALNYHGSINGATFTTTALIKDPDRHYTDHITGQFIKSLLINNSNFTDYISLGNRTGINAMTVNLIVSNTAFNNLDYGIYAASTNVTASVKSTLNTFTGNRTGIYLRRVDFCQLTDNTFTLDESIMAGFPKYGVYLDHCSGYKVEDNSLTGINNNDTPSFGIGILNSNSYSNILENNFLYRNTLTNIDLAIVPMHKNIEGNNGLLIHCNNIDQSDYADIFVFASSSVTTDIGIKDFQGECSTTDPTKPANNLFSTTAPLYGNFMQQPAAHDISYQYANGGGTYQTEPLIHSIDVYPTECDVFTTPSYNPTTSCPEHFFAGTGVLIGTIAHKKNQINDLNDQIDNGNSAALITYVNSNPANYLLSQTLTEASPYLSDEVLIAMINRTPLVPDYIINNICKANAPLHDNVWLALINRSSTLPDWVIAQIAAEHNLLSQTVQLALINKVVPLQVSTLNTILLNNSPLTDEVLKAMLERAAPMPAWSINQILGVNTPLNQDVEDAMYAHIPALPNWVISQINGSTFIAGEPSLNSTQLSPMDELSIQIGSLNADRDYAKAELIRYYIFNEDSTVNWLDSLRIVFENESDAKDICRLADVYVAKGEYVNALITYDAVLTMGVISMDDYIAHRKALVNGDIRIKGCEHLWTDSEMMQDIEELSLIIDPKRSETDEARAILDFINRDLKGEIYVLPESESQNKSMTTGSNEEDKSIHSESTFVYLAPNPTSDGARVYVRGDFNQIENVYVFDLQGNVVNGYQVSINNGMYYIETTGLSNGIYLINVELSDGNSQVLKLNVIH
jgi:hypothetical protein